MKYNDVSVSTSIPHKAAKKYNGILQTLAIVIDDIMSVTMEDTRHIKSTLQ